MPFRFSFFSRSRQTTKEKTLEKKLVERLKINIRRTKMPAEGISDVLLQIADNVAGAKSEDELSFYSTLLTYMLRQLKFVNSDTLGIDDFIKRLESNSEKFQEKELTRSEYRQSNILLIDNYMKNLDDQIQEFEENEKILISKLSDLDEKKDKVEIAKIQKQYKVFESAIVKILKIKNQLLSIKYNNLPYTQSGRKHRRAYTNSRQLRHKMMLDFQKLKILATGEDPAITSEYKNKNVNNSSVNHALEDLAAIVTSKGKYLTPLHSKRENYEFIVMTILSVAGAASGLNIKSDTLFSALESGAALESFGKDAHEGALIDYIKNNPTDFLLKLLSLISLPIFFVTMPPAALISLQGLGLFGSCKDMNDLRKELSSFKRIGDTEKAIEKIDFFFNIMKKINMDKIVDKASMEEFKKIKSELNEIKLEETTDLQSKKLPGKSDNQKYVEITSRLRFIGEKIHQKQFEQNALSAEILSPKRPR